MEPFVVYCEPALQKGQEMITKLHLLGNPFYDQNFCNSGKWGNNFLFFLSRLNSFPNKFTWSTHKSS